MLVHKYELFKMETNETISNMFTRFTDIINGLKSLGKIYTNVEMVKKKLGNKGDRYRRNKRPHKDES